MQDLSFDQYLKLVEIVVWPLTIILLGYSFHNEFRKFINRMVDLELPGGVRIKAKKQKQSDVNEKRETIVNEKDRFEYFKSFLVTNTRAALLWFYRQEDWIKFNVFNDLYDLPDKYIGIDIPHERLVIFSILLQFDLLESKKSNFFKISNKGIRFLKFIKYIS